MEQLFSFPKPEIMRIFIHRLVGKEFKFVLVFLEHLEVNNSGKTLLNLNDPFNDFNYGFVENQLLIKACKFSNEAIMKKMIGLGLDLSKVGPFGKDYEKIWISNATAAATNSNNLQILEILLEKVPN